MASYRMREVVNCDYFYDGPNTPQTVEIRMECGHVEWRQERSDRKYPGDWCGAKSRCYTCGQNQDKFLRLLLAVANGEI